MGITALLYGPCSPQAVELPRPPSEGQMLLVDGHSYVIKVVEWVANEGHINIYLWPS
jgi:hypothetical protein